MIRLRRATSADASALATLRWAFRAGREAPSERAAPFIRRCTAWMRRALAARAPRGPDRAIARWRAWVAVVDRRIVGQVWLMTWAKLPNPVGERTRHAYVSNFYVSPASRGGVGGRLLRAALADADRSRVHCVILWPSVKSVPLYERHGFTRAGELMVRSKPRRSAARSRTRRSGRWVSSRRKP